MIIIPVDGNSLGPFNAVKEESDCLVCYDTSGTETAKYYYTVIGKYTLDQDDTKLPVPKVPPPTQDEYVTAIQTMLDTAAQDMGYDSILSAVTYADNHVPKFASEGGRFKNWRSDVWAAAFSIQEKVVAGDMPPPTVAELLAMLPTLPSDGV